MSEKLTNQDAMQMIAERARNLSEIPEVKAKCIEIAQKEGMDAAKDFVYRLSIATLFGMPD